VARGAPPVRGPSPAESEQRKPTIRHSSDAISVEWGWRRGSLLSESGGDSVHKPRRGAPTAGNRAPSGNRARRTGLTRQRPVTVCPLTTKPSRGALDSHHPWRPSALKWLRSASRLMMRQGDDDLSRARSARATLGKLPEEDLLRLNRRLDRVSRPGRPELTEHTGVRSQLDGHSGCR